MNSTRSTKAKQGWAVRRTNAARIERYNQTPVCLCGCGGQLNPTKKTRFLVGHDSRLKSLLAAVARGDKKSIEIPDVARLMRRRIGFLKTNPELARVFSTFRVVRND